MATATKPKEAEVVEFQHQSDIRHVVRVLGPENNPAMGVVSYEDTERHLRETYFREGWALKKTHVVKSTPGREHGGLNYDTVTMLYILVKPGAAA